MNNNKETEPISSNHIYHADYLKYHIFSCGILATYFKEMIDSLVSTLSFSNMTSKQGYLIVLKKGKVIYLTEAFSITTVAIFRIKSILKTICDDDGVDAKA